MSLYPVAGAKLYIGGALNDKNADFTAADFASQTWTEIDGWETMGAIGDTSKEIATELINRGRSIKQKGTRDAGSMENEFAIISGDPGQEAVLAAERTRSNFAFRIVFDDAPITTAKAATITIASPGVVTSTAHGYSDGDKVVFSTTGALPTGLAAGTTYYVVSSTANSFSVAATSGGSAIVTTGTQSGVHTVSKVASGSQRLFIALVMSAEEQGGGADTVQKLKAKFGINSNVVKIAAG
ncbi:hypothetical protein AEAC466_13460 [Asticcacaulis sp. AC466]|uniref:hypothetical protein n=1 Tax=Asticcacaulis sp. AC466 TaxID=1282362 RepID=UPI0003C3DF63|nr:hypothetical protein [Asticcacaulis sp. AC466]ESQ83254.1 hypothetical protein AEAC466_13460 [Asticcacaulis sp. AC466]